MYHMMLLFIACLCAAPFLLLRFFIAKNQICTGAWLLLGASEPALAERAAFAWCRRRYVFIFIYFLYIFLLIKTHLCSIYLFFAPVFFFFFFFFGVIVVCNNNKHITVPPSFCIFFILFFIFAFMLFIIIFILYLFQGTFSEELVYTIYYTVPHFDI